MNIFKRLKELFIMDESKEKTAIVFKDEELKEYVEDSIELFIRDAKKDGYHIMGDIDKYNYMKNWLDKNVKI